MVVDNARVVHLIRSHTGWDQGDATAPAGWTCGFHDAWEASHEYLVEEVAKKLGG